MRLLRILVTGIVSHLVLAGCGSTHGEADGFLTDHNICHRSEPTEPDSGSAAVPAGFEQLTGTFGSNPRAAQEFHNIEKRELWGLQLYLSAPIKPMQGVTVSIVTPDADGGPGGNELASLNIAPGMIPAEGGWVDAQLRALAVLEPAKLYWLSITPHYGSSDSGRVAWGYANGRGLATYSSQTTRWTVEPNKAALFRLIECK